MALISFFIDCIAMGIVIAFWFLVGGVLLLLQYFYNHWPWNYGREIYLKVLKGGLLVTAFVVMAMCHSSIVRGEVQSLYFEADSYVGTQYEPYISKELAEDETLTYRILTGFKYIGYRTGDFNIFWDLEVDGKATTKQFRYTALDTAVGMRISQIDIFYRHKSEHMLEHKPEAHFPLCNYIGIRWHLIGKGNR